MKITKLINCFIATLLLLICNFVFVISSVKASDEFSTDYNVTYTVKENGVTEVNNKITLTNNNSNIYATSYSIVLDSIEPKNYKAYSIDNVHYELSKINDNNKTTLKVVFPDTVVGVNKSRVFNIDFEVSNFALKTGEVWEISIPKISDYASFDTYNLKLRVPVKFGQEAYISPEPLVRTNQDDFLVYSFNKNNLSKAGVVAGFGEFQVFSFNLSYHLENPISRKTITQITLPPDTAYQRVYYENIDPVPHRMYIDVDGNWVAEYLLEPRQRIDVVAKGTVQIFSNYRPFIKPTDESIVQNLQKQEYWDISHPEIKSIASGLKTPRQIYDFVSTKLKYDYTRVKANVERLGAVNSLNNPNSAICMEFTDLFITLARSAGIPAREINGFAYTENPEIQPLSLVNDVLHAWPEYYDAEKGVWIPVDPTWGSTTGGVDYFSKLDLRHFTFVIHGKDSKSPFPAGSYKLGSNPQKDVYVTFGTLPVERNSKLSLKGKIESWLPLMPNRINIDIENTGPVAIYDLKPAIYFDNQLSEENSYNKIDYLLPSQKYILTIDIPFTFLATKTPDIVKVDLNNTEISINTNKNHVMIYNLLFIFIVFLIISITIFNNLKKWKFQKKNS